MCSVDQVTPAWAWCFLPIVRRGRSLNKVLGRENGFSMRELEAFVKEYSVDEGY